MNGSHLRCDWRAIGLDGVGAGAVLERQKAETKINAAPSGMQPERGASEGGMPAFLKACLRGRRPRRRMCVTDPPGGLNQGFFSNKGPPEFSRKIPKQRRQHVGA